jgi:hypothetical protein
MHETCSPAAPVADGECAARLIARAGFAAGLERHATELASCPSCLSSCLQPLLPRAALAPARYPLLAQAAWTSAAAPASPRDPSTAFRPCRLVLVARADLVGHLSLRNVAQGSSDAATKIRHKPHGTQESPARPCCRPRVARRAYVQRCAAGPTRSHFSISLMAPGGPGLPGGPGVLLSSPLASSPGLPGAPRGPGGPCGPLRFIADSKYASAARRWSTSWLISWIAVSSAFRLSS